MNSYYPSILLGFDKDYYSYTYNMTLNDFNVVRIGLTGEQKLVSQDKIVANIQLRKGWTYSS